MPNNDSTSQKERREAEVALLQAMYPDGLLWNEQHEEITYKTGAGAVLTLRLPDDYPGESAPTLISALGPNKIDLRDLTRRKIEALNAPSDEEMVDAILQVFEEVVSNIEDSHVIEVDGSQHPAPSSKARTATHKTVIVWLHHLLNTNKRKLALHPSVSPATISGITKPGYPGILIYSGSAEAVDAHVAELKNQRWQAFQVRFEEEVQKPWIFSVSSGITEVESMSEVTQAIADGRNREAFLRAVGVK